MQMYWVRLATDIVVIEYGLITYCVKRDRVAEDVSNSQIHNK